jgi:hypothetical protein
VDAALAVADAVVVVARITLARPLQPRKACVKLLEEPFSIVGRRLPQIKCELLGEKITKHVGTTHGQDISNELQNETAVVTIAKPAHAAAVILWNTAREDGQTNIHNAQRVTCIKLEAAAAAAADARAPMDLVILQNEIAQGELELTEPVPAQLTGRLRTVASGELIKNEMLVLPNIEARHLR